MVFGKSAGFGRAFLFGITSSCSGSDSVPSPITKQTIIKIKIQNKKSFNQPFLFFITATVLSSDESVRLHASLTYLLKISGLSA